MMTRIAVGAAERDEKAVAESLGAITEYIKNNDVGGYQATKEFIETIAQLRKDIDAQATQIRSLERAGLNVSNRGVELMGRRDIMDLRRVGRVFQTRQQAEGFGALCARAVHGNSARYKEIVSAKARDLAEQLTKDLDPGVSTQGTELVANIYMADLIAHVEAVGVLFTECDRVPLATTGQTIYPKLTGEVTAAPVAVAAALAESTPTFGTVTLTPVKWGLITPVPNEFFRNPTLLDQLGQRLAWQITRAIAYAFDNALVNGDGTAAYGTITGLLQSSNLTAVTAGSATTLATYTAAEVGSVIAGMAKDYVTDPKWYMSLSAERTLRNIRATTGQPLYERGGNGEPNTIDNYPYSICQRFPAAAAATADVKWGAFGDLRLSHYFGMLCNIQIDQSEHVRFENDMTVLRGLAHADAAEKDADATVVAKTAAA